MRLINETTQNVELHARELFGFNIGGFSEVPTGLYLHMNGSNYFRFVEQIVEQC